MAFPALADSPSMERQPGPPLQPVAQPSSPAAAPPNTTMVSPPPSTQLAPLPSPPSPPSSSPPSVPVLASPPPVLTPAPNPPEPTLPPPAVPPSLPPVTPPSTAPNSTATALVPSRTPPPAFTSIPETPLTSPSPPHIPTAPATSHPPPAPSSQSKSAQPPTKSTLPPPINLSTPPQPPVPVPTTPSLPEEAPPLPPAPARHSQSPATPLAQVSPPNQPGVSAPVNSTSSKPPPATSSVTPSWNPPPTYLASSPLPPNESANASLPVAVGGKTGERPEVSHVSSRLIAGAAIGGVVLIVVFVSVLLFVCCKQWKKRRGNPRKVSYRSHSSSSGLKDSFTANLPPGFQYPYESISPGTGVHVIMASQQTFAPHHPLSSNGGSGSIDQGPEMHPSVGASLSISRGTFTYVELMDATDSFSEDNLLGEGGFGYVHKGVLANGKEIAVKQLKIGSHQGEREFQAELDIISHVHHKNLVTLLGYCISGAGRFLVYEFVPNHTLEFHLHGKEQPVLDWRTRLKIAIGTAKGLAYLHEDCSPKIIHRDIKAANILLDFNFEAKVSDFGLAKLFSDGNANVSHISTRVVGTFGYLAPEYASSGQLTAKSDVYSFGVVLLELITGCPPIKRTESSTDEGHGLVNWARPLLNQAMETGNFSSVVDPRLQNNCNSGEVMNMIGCAAACVRHSAWLRPQMSQIIHALERDGSLADLNEGIRPGESKLYSSSDMNRFRTILASQEHDFTRLSDATSEYGLYPSCSSSEAQHTR